MSLPDVFYFFILLLLFTFVYATVGFNLFRGKFPAGNTR
jgi:hypothetical protein